MAANFMHISVILRVDWNWNTVKINRDLENTQITRVSFVFYFVFPLWESFVPSNLPSDNEPYCMF